MYLVRALAHMRDPAQVLAECWQVLAPGGQLTVVAHSPDHLAGLLPDQPAPSAPLTALPGTRLNLTRPVVLSPEVQQTLLNSYGLSGHPAQPLHTQLQLSGWTASAHRQAQR
ncbi:hypothetical protein [Deinococcus sonorensis]|uniref:hypothetical protein n=1 Tax=Deinococcus sonorensis TaxID=309891 RepID=UPI003305C4EF